MFAALIFTISPVAYGEVRTELGCQAVLGAGVPLVPGLKGTFALEVPFTFLVRQSVGLTPLVGIAWKF